MSEEETTAENLKTATPIFVIGRNRSGTKWLSNLISNHPDVASLQREGAGGIIEVNELYNLERVFGDPAVEENRMAFLAYFKTCNAFHLSGLDPASVDKIDFVSYQDFFGQFMNQYRVKADKVRWLQKSMPLALPKLLAAFPESKFILTERLDYLDNIRSSIALKWREAGAVGSKRLIVEAFHYQQARKYVDQYRDEPNVYDTSYEAIRSDKEAVLKSVCAFLELKFDEMSYQDTFAPNTSYDTGISKDTVLSAWDKFLLKAYISTLRMLPFRFYALISSILASLHRYQPGRRMFHEHSFSIQKNLTERKGR